MFDEAENVVKHDFNPSAHRPQVTRIEVPKPEVVFFFFFFFFFLIWVLRPFQEYFTYIEPIVHRRWANTGKPGEKPPDHPLSFLSLSCVFAT